MKKERRIKRADEFQGIIKKRNSELNSKFVIYHVPKQESYARVGVSVGKKLGNAVLRNKVKRQLRMMIQDIYQKSYSFDSVVIVRSKYFKSDYASNKQELNELFDYIEQRRYANAKIK
ncbi:MAG: ribonuclease P protein component [Erysipelothrix sp.]|nr:ribonuclease P protein component [Erysipelothrix sp.]